MVFVSCQLCIETTICCTLTENRQCLRDSNQLNILARKFDFGFYCWDICLMDCVNQETVNKSVIVELEKEQSTKVPSVPDHILTICNYACHIPTNFLCRGIVLSYKASTNYFNVLTNPYVLEAFFHNHTLYIVS